MALDNSSEKFTDSAEDIIKEEKKPYTASHRKDDYVVVNTSPIVGWVYDWSRYIIFTLVFAVIILTFFFRIVGVDGRSMMNTLMDGDKMIVTSFMYTPKDGDIVVISRAQKYDKAIVKRIIATEGQTLQIDYKNQRVYVDGVLIDEPYVSSELKEGNAEIPSVIPQGKVFVMGDNRFDSLDSRSIEIGLIDVENIIGKAQCVVYPFKRMQMLYED